jgi:hypothetical protein
LTPTSFSAFLNRRILIEPEHLPGRSRSILQST